MANNIILIAYPAKDLEKDKAFFSTYLGTEPYMANAYYVGYKVGDMEVGLDPHGKAVIAYTDTDDIEANLKTLKEAGAEVVMEPKDVGAGLLIAQVEINGNVVGLRQQPAK